MEFRVLGPLEVSDGDRQIEVGGSKRRAVLALLVLHANEVVGSDRLIDELWGENPPRNASASLHNHVSRLRKSLGTDVLATKPWGYVLRADPESIDLGRFRRLVSEAETLPAAERTEKLRDALSLWRGRPLEDLAFEPSVAKEIAPLEELQIAVLERRIDGDLEVGRHAEVIGELEGLIAENPVREHLRAQLILALYRSGRQAEALEVYRETRRVLSEELGIEPSPELRELQRAMLRQDPGLAAAPVVPAGRAAEDLGGPPPPSPSRRRGILLAAAAALILAGGAGAAVLASRDWNTPNRSAEETTPRAQSLAAPVVETLARHTRTARSMPTSVRHAPTRRSQVRRKGDGRTLSVAAATTTAAPRPSASPPAARKTTHPRPSPAKKAPPAIRISDSFSNAVIDRQLWYVFTEGTGEEVNERNGRLELSIRGDGVPGGDYNQISGQIGTHCHFSGDFDASVDYELLRWPAENGAYVQLAAFFDNGGAGVSRQSHAGEAYSTWIPPHGSMIPTTDTRGRLRLRRVGGVVTTYYRRGRRWAVLERAPMPGTANLALQVFSPARDFGHADVAAAFDNFVVTGPGIVGPACTAA